MVSLLLNQRQVPAVLLMESFKRYQGTNIKGSPQVAGSIIGFNKKMARRYRNNFLANKVNSQSVGRASRSGIVSTTLKKRAAAWVGENAMVLSDEGYSQREIAAWFDCSQKSVSEIVKKQRLTGSVRDLKISGRMRKEEERGQHHGP